MTEKKEYIKKEYINKQDVLYILDSNLTPHQKREAIAELSPAKVKAISTSKVYAVDFDGVLCEDAYPIIGKPYVRNIEYLKNARKKGDKIILWTCRDGELLEQAVSWCSAQGLEFDAINDNLPEMIEQYGTNPRKIGADYYIDDKAVIFNEFQPVLPAF